MWQNFAKSGHTGDGPFFIKPNNIPKVVGVMTTLSREVQSIFFKNFEHFSAKTARPFFDKGASINK